MIGTQPQPAKERKESPICSKAIMNKASKLKLWLLMITQTARVTTAHASEKSEPPPSCVRQDA